VPDFSETKKRKLDDEELDEANDNNGFDHLGRRPYERVCRHRILTWSVWLDWLGTRQKRDA
jgi:hypothetical protein